MTWLLLYITIGVVINFIIDLAADRIVENGIDTDENIRFDWFTRILVGLFWPLALGFLIIKYIKEMKK